VISATLPVTTALAQTVAQPEIAPAASPATARVPSFIVPVPPTSRKTAPALPRRMWPFLKARVEAIPAGPPPADSMALPLIISTSRAAAPVTPAASPLPERRGTAQPTKPRAATTLTVVNGSEVPATTITITGEAKAVSYAGPLAPKAQATLKLPTMTGCLVRVEATFAGGSVSDGSPVDVCRVKLVRLTD
jgi:hypothetical protein